MQKERAFKFVILGVLLSIVLFEAIGFVTAQAGSPILDPIKKMFIDWQEGQLSVNLAKYLLVALLTAIIYSILDFTPFLKGPDKSTVRGFISLLVSFLSVAYLNSSEVYGILASYSALGFVLSAAVPFVILLFFSITTHKDGGVFGRIFARVIWLGFIAFLAYKIIYGSTLTGIGEISNGLAIGYLIVIGVSLVWAFVAEKKFIKFYFREELATAKETLKRELELQQAKRRLEAQTMKGEGEGI